MVLSLGTGSTAASSLPSSVISSPPVNFPTSSAFLPPSAIVELENGERFKGESLARGMSQKKIYPLISGLDAKLTNAIDGHAILCKIGTIDPEKAKEKILVCCRGETARVEKSLVAMEAGAVGVILCNDKFSGAILWKVQFGSGSGVVQKKKKWWSTGCF
ncbi:subtilisin-like protease SBT5.4 [Arachis stenosperma]|uniref:subtilisin-like protease SBT5.4 n=1 Tax=Arachis stenosperma TaxID=217475 RepID=UPI0025AC0899|nr:subtilisin-like protease SBT5.4 [Arachis stenosperma]